MGQSITPETQLAQKAPELIKELFIAAQKGGGIEFIFTLVRVDSMGYGIPDPILRFYSSLSSLKKEKLTLDEKDLASKYWMLAKEEEPLKVLWPKNF